MWGLMRPTDEKNFAKGRPKMSDNEKPKYSVGDVVRMKKTHPCGSNEWSITRTGMDFGIKCVGCGHFVMMPRKKFERMCKEIVKKNDE